MMEMKVQSLCDETFKNFLKAEMVCTMCGGADTSDEYSKIHNFVKTVRSRSYFRNALLKSRTAFLLLPFNPEILPQILLQFERSLVSSISSFIFVFP